MSAAPSGSAALPAGRFFALTWTIPDNYGGLTSAMLHRSRAFVRLGAVPVEILTFEDGPDYADIQSRLLANGEMFPGMRLTNLWDWLRQHDVVPSASPLGASQRAFTPLGADRSYRSVHRGGMELQRSRLAADGKTVLQTDYYRPDGSLLVSDRQDTTEAGTRGGRSVVLCDGDGQPARSWGSKWALYRYWLDQLTAGDDDCYLIADSKPVSRFLYTYRRRRRTTVAVIHGSHLAGSIGPWGRLRPSRAEVLRHLDGYDAVVFLTDRQRRDVNLMFGRHSNVRVIPNSRVMSAPPGWERSPSSGIVLGALSRIKRPEHAIRAVRLARRFDTNVTLDIFGGGPRRPALERLISDAERDGPIRLHGYDRDARDRLSTASFLLLTSRSEGFGLVLLEAMSAGCIPIAYDIRYGPADLIQHRRNGFLVTRGNLLGLARAILRLQRMPPRQVTQMREAARRTAEEYRDEATLPLWAKELVVARERNREALSAS